MAARLVVSLSGLTDRAPASLARGASLAAALDERGVVVTHLFRPRGAAAEDGSPLVAWLRARCAAGDALALHGYDHAPDPTGARAGIGRRAEFAALPRHEAALRLVAARRALAAVRLHTDVFVPPRWLASAGTVAALCEQGFAVCADEGGVRLLGAGRELRARLLGFRGSGRPAAADRWAAEGWRAYVLVGGVGRTARRGGLVRLAVRAKDLDVDGRHAAVLAAVDAALALGAEPTTYRGLAADLRYRVVGTSRSSTRTAVASGASFSNSP